MWPCTCLHSTLLPSRMSPGLTDTEFYGLNQKGLFLAKCNIWLFQTKKTKKLRQIPVVHHCQSFATDGSLRCISGSGHKWLGSCDPSFRGFINSRPITVTANAAHAFAKPIFENGQCYIADRENISMSEKLFYYYCYNHYSVLIAKEYINIDDKKQVTPRQIWNCTNL